MMRKTWQIRITSNLMKMTWKRGCWWFRFIWFWYFGSRCTSKLTVETRQRCENLTNFMRNFAPILRKLTMVLLAMLFVVGRSGYDYYKSLLWDNNWIIGEDLHGLLINKSNPVMINRGPIHKCYTFLSRLIFHYYYY